MGALVGLLFGLGVVLVLRARRPAVRERRAASPVWHTRTRHLLLAAGVEAVTPVQFVAVSAGCGLLAFVLALGISHVPVIALAFALFAGLGPRSLLRWRARQRAGELRAVWPEVVDNLASAVRAGLSLPEAVAAIAERGPQVLRPAFRRFADDYRASGRFGPSLDRLKDQLADPVADRLVEALRLAREVGGGELGRLLRTLSTFLREDARTRAELETRQGWTVNAARLAVAAPWLLIAVLSLRPQAVAAYNTAAGGFVLAIGGAVSLVAYRLMLRIARLPIERRVLR